MAWWWTGARRELERHPRGRVRDGDVGGGVPGGAVGDRAFFVVPALVGSVFLLVLAVVPGSPGYLNPTVAAAAALGAVAVPSMFIAPAAYLRRLTLLVCVVMSALVVVALAVTESGALVVSLLFWFPWAGSQVGLAWRRLDAVMVHVTLMAGIILGVFSLHGSLAEYPLAGLGSVLGVLAAAPLTHTSFQRGRARILTDSLTALASSAGLIQAGDPLVAGMTATGRQTVMMIVDIDHFKELNSAFGYEAGDDALRTFGRWLCLVRPPPLLVARLGGDKFVLLLPGEASGGGRSSPPEMADPVLTGLGRDVLTQLEGRLRIGGVDVEVEATAGITTAPACGERIVDLLSCADAALADARRGGERVGVWTTACAAVRPWELALHAELRSAMDLGELELHYQPMREVATGRIVGVEALMRWRHPERGLLPPGSFLPMAERSSLIVELTWWELDEALRQCARWRSEGIPLTVSANLSPRLLVVDELPRIVAERLAAYDLPPDALTLEITENALVSQPARAAAMLGELRVFGVKLSMDDFGTGYNSMEILKVLTFDEIKIDRSFVVDAQGSLLDVAIVRSVVDLGHRLGLRVVGEGVEDEAGERILTELGCDVLQGYKLSPPLPARDLAPLLAADGGPRTTGTVSGKSGGSGESRPPPGEVPPRARERWSTGGLAAPIPADEDSRLAALRNHRILDTAAEPEFDEIVELAAQVADCTYAYVSFVDAEREWFKSSHGLKAAGLAGRVGVASHAVWSGEYLEVPDASRDLRFAHVVRADPRVPLRFLAAAPLRTMGGHAFGALCVADRLPRRLAPGQRRALCCLASQTIRLCDARRERLMSEDVAGALSRLDQFWHPDDLPAAATLIAEVIHIVTGSDAVGVMVAKMPGATVFEAAGWSVAAGTEPLPRVGARATPDDEAALRALSQLREPIFIADPTGTPLIPAERVDQLKIGSAMVIPLPDVGGLLGFVTVRWTNRLTSVEPAVMRAVSLFATSARYTVARLRPTSEGATVATGSSARR
ncbi:diguanylate cyclase [Frankia sp. Hr75.2]|nr:diguanylate cyclase [Frankia sp. Hr75.2]